MPVLIANIQRKGYVSFKSDTRQGCVDLFAEWLRHETTQNGPVSVTIFMEQ